MSVEWPAAPPRPGRTARWLIGLGVAAVLAVTSFTFLIIGLAGLDWTDETGSDATVTATATVLDVDAYQDDYSGDRSITVPAPAPLLTRSAVPRPCSR